MTSRDVIVYSRLATDLLKKLHGIEEETLTGEDCTNQKLEVIFEVFQHIDAMAEDRYKKLHEHSSEHFPEDSNTIN